MDVDQAVTTEPSIISFKKTATTIIGIFLVFITLGIRLESLWRKASKQTLILWFCSVGFVMECYIFEAGKGDGWLEEESPVGIL